MTTSFFTADTEYHPLHDVATVARPIDSTERAKASTAGWIVSGISALVGLATLSVIGSYALDEFTQSPVPASTIAPSVSVAVAPPAPTPRPPGPRTPEAEETSRPASRRGDRALAPRRADPACQQPRGVHAPTSTATPDVATAPLGSANSLASPDIPPIPKLRRLRTDPAAPPAG